MDKTERNSIKLLHPEALGSMGLILRDLADYVLLALLVLGCNSVYCHIYGQTYKGDFRILALIILSAGILLRKNDRNERFAQKALLLALYNAVVLLCIYYKSASLDFLIESCLLLLPLAAIYISQQDRPEELLFKFENIVLFLAAASLFFWLFGSLFGYIKPTGIVRCTWGKTPYYYNWYGLYVQRINNTPFTIALLKTVLKQRNFGIFTEPAEYNVVLTIALYTEIFLRKKITPWRAGLICAAMLSTASTTAFVMLILAALMFFADRRKISKKALAVIAAAAAAAIAILLIGKSASAGFSFQKHFNDIFGALKAWLKKPLTGWGYENYEPLINEMDPVLFAKDPGFSNALPMILAMGGLLLGADYILPAFLCMSGKKVPAKYRSLALAILILYIFVNWYKTFLFTFTAAFMFAVFWKREEKETEPGPRKKPEKRRIIAVTAALAAFAVLTLLLLPAMRSFITLYSYWDDGREWIAITVIAAYSAVCFVLSYMLYRLIRGDRSKSTAVISATAAAGLVFGIVMLNFAVARKQEEFGSSVSGESAVFEQLAAGCREGQYTLTSDTVPSSFNREFGNIGNNIFIRNWHIPREDDTVITENRDFHWLIMSGYRYAKISDRYAVYTNSTSAAEILENSGITLCTDYAQRYEADLGETARLNALSLTDEGHVIINEASGALLQSPSFTIDAGVLRAEFKMKIISSSEEDDELGTVSVVSNYGTVVLKSAPILRSDTDENGAITVNLEAKVNFSEETEYLIRTNGDTEIEVLSISWGKAGTG